MSGRVADVTGGLGEKIAELAPCRFDERGDSFFRVAFLGEKWEATDLLVVPEPAGGLRPYLFAQVKATRGPLPADRGGAAISVRGEAIAKLRAIPGPTYLLVVHVPTERVFARAVLADEPARGIGGVATANGLTPDRPRALRDEVVDFWSAAPAPKPTDSNFR